MPKRAARTTAQGSQPSRPVKRATNLTLDPDAVARGERYGARHGRKLSQLVNGFLAALPADDADDAPPDLAPAVRRLYGVAGDSAATRDTHRAYLAAKYGSGDG